jgi:hypothetical protein
MPSYHVFHVSIETEAECLVTQTVNTHDFIHVCLPCTHPAFVSAAIAVSYTAYLKQFFIDSWAKTIRAIFSLFRTEFWTEHSSTFIICQI